MIKWYDILPYKKGEDDINGIKALLDHVGNFVIVIHRGDSGEVGISIGARKEMATAITMLDGMEVMVRDTFDFERYEKYRRYKHKRHCAIPISGREADLESLYGILDREVSGLAFLAVNIKKTASMSRVYSYIRCMENGQSPGAMSSITSIMSTPPKTKSVSAMRQNRIQNAKTKIAQATHLFSCEIISGGTSAEYLQAIETVFPFDAFKAGRINAKKAKKLMAGNPSPPMFGGSTHPLLSETELLSFLGFPSEEDLLKTNLRHGKTTSYTSGSRIADMDSTVGDMLKDIAKGEGAKPDDDEPKDSDGTADTKPDNDDPKDGDGAAEANEIVESNDSAGVMSARDVDKPITLTEFRNDDNVDPADNAEPSDGSKNDAGAGSVVDEGNDGGTKVDSDDGDTKDDDSVKADDGAANAGADVNVPAEQDDDDSWDWNITEK